MNSSWDWWDTFRLHEAACLIAGVPVGPKRAPEPLEIPADARPVFKRLLSAYYQGQDYLKSPENIGCPPAKILIGLPRSATETITEFLVTREELHRYIQAMGLKSVYQFLPSGEGCDQEFSALPKPVEQPEATAPSPESVVTQSPTETTKQRRARWLDWYGQGERGALSEVYRRELLTNPKADRSFIGKEIKKAKQERVEAKQSNAMYGQLAQDGKRKG
jgi:hypothetical protein